MAGKLTALRQVMTSYVPLELRGVTIAANWGAAAVSAYIAPLVLQESFVTDNVGGGVLFVAGLLASATALGKVGGVGGRRAGRPFLLVMLLSPCHWEGGKGGKG